MHLTKQTIDRILSTLSPHIRRTGVSRSFAIVITVDEGTAARFAAANWSDQTLVKITSDLVAELGWKNIDQSIGRRIVLKGSLAGDQLSASIDCGSGFVPIEVLR